MKIKTFTDDYGVVRVEVPPRNERVKWYIIPNATLALVMFLGFVTDIEPARWIIYTITWFTAIASLTLYTDHMREFMVRAGRTFPQWVDAIYDVAVVLTFILFDHYVFALVYFSHMVHYELAWNAVGKILKEREDDNGK